MKTKLLMCWIAAGALGVARPGALDSGFDPELRAWVAPDHATVAADGRVWIGGGFDRGDGYSTGDLVRLGANGGVESEPASGYLKRVAPYVSIGFGVWNPQSPTLAEPFLLENGDFLLRGESGGWLRMRANGKVMGKAFPDRRADEIITPQFERTGALWVIRQFANGERHLEKRHSANGLLDVGFSPASESPINITTAVPGRDGDLWLLAADEFPWDFYSFYPYGSPTPVQKVFRMNANGSLQGEPRVIPGTRSLSLVRGLAGSFRLVYGEDPSRWWFWPSPSSSSYRIEWYSANGEMERSKDFYVGVFERFVWAESADGLLVAPNRKTEIPGSLQGNFEANSKMRRYRPDGSEDPSFSSPGGVTSIKALAGGKWLVNGMRRLNANGSVDSSWKIPDLSRPAAVKTLLPLPGGKVLATGDFAKVDGQVRNRLVVFRANGAVDPSFVADPRIGEPVSVAVTRNAIYLINSSVVTYKDGSQFELVKVRLDGTIDESFRPPFRGTNGFIYTNQLFPTQVLTGSTPGVVLSLNLGRARRVTAMANQELLVETSQNLGYTHQAGLTRLRENGALVAGFKSPADFRGSAGIFPLKNGGFISGGVFYRADGSVERDISSPDFWPTPLCEISGGILFKTAGTSVPSKLALWTPNGFARWFQAPELDWGSSVSASPGEWGTFYLAATLANARPSIHRLFLNGKLDRTFRGPTFEYSERQFGRDWWKAEESGKVAFNPTLPPNQISTPWPLFYGSQSLLWHPSTRTVWTGGFFNRVNRHPRDGLARIQGGFSGWPWR